MGKMRHWLLLVLSSLGFVVVGSTPPALAATLVEHNAIPNVEQRWSASSFSSLLEPAGAPEFGRCIKTVGGEYENAGCTETGGGGKNYEWYSAFGSAHPVEKANFTETLEGAGTPSLETVGKNAVACEGETALGKYTGNKTIGSMVATFTGCSAFGMSCTSSGSATGTIVTHTLEGVLGIEELGAEPSLDKIGEDLFPIGHSGSIAEFSCGGVPMAISGSIISPVASNSMKLKTTIRSKGVKGKQRPENFVGEPAEVLKTTIEGGSPEQAAETLPVTQTNEEKIEINTVL
jgi:hypothetical protein